MVFVPLFLFLWMLLFSFSLGFQAPSLSLFSKDRTKWPSEEEDSPFCLHILPYPNAPLFMRWVPIRNAFVSSCLRVAAVSSASDTSSHAAVVDGENTYLAALVLDCGDVVHSSGSRRSLRFRLGRYLLGEPKLWIVVAEEKLSRIWNSLSWR